MSEAFILWIIIKLGTSRSTKHMCSFRCYMKMKNAIHKEQVQSTLRLYLPPVQARQSSYKSIQLLTRWYKRNKFLYLQNSTTKLCCQTIILKHMFVASLQYIPSTDLYHMKVKVTKSITQNLGKAKFLVTSVDLIHSFLCTP